MLLGAFDGITMIYIFVIFSESIFIFSLSNIIMSSE